MANAASVLLWSTTWTSFSLLFLLVVVFQFDTILSKYVRDCSQAPSGGPFGDGGDVYSCLNIPLTGLGFFTAGYAANGNAVPGAKPGENRVLWSDLTVENACREGDDVFELYAKPLGLCGVGDRISLPTNIRRVQLEIQVAIFCCFLAWMSALIYMCSFSHRMAVTVVGMCATAAIACIHCVYLWLNWEGTKLYTSPEGFYLPLWASDMSSTSTQFGLDPFSQHGNGKLRVGLNERGLVVIKQHLDLNNPQFHIFVWTIPSLVVSMLGIGWIAASQLVTRVGREIETMVGHDATTPLLRQRRA